jgi:hypothetical protein
MAKPGPSTSRGDPTRSGYDPKRTSEAGGTSHRGHWMRFAAFHSLLTKFTPATNAIGGFRSGRGWSTHAPLDRVVGLLGKRTSGHMLAAIGG